MKKTLLLITLIFFALEIKAEKLPETYHRFRSEFMTMQAHNNLAINSYTTKWIGIGAGVALFATSGYFLVNDQMKNFQYTILIGGALYIPTLVIMILSEDKYGNFPYR